MSLVPLLHLRVLENFPTIKPNLYTCSDLSQLFRLFVDCYFNIWKCREGDCSAETTWPATDDGDAEETGGCRRHDDKQTVYRNLKLFKIDLREQKTWIVLIKVTCMTCFWNSKASLIMLINADEASHE